MRVENRNSRTLLLLRMPPPGGLPVALHERVLDAEMIEDARDDEIDQLFGRIGPAVEARRRGQDQRARVGELQHVLQRDAGIGRLPRNDDELAALLEADLGGALDEVRRRAGRDAADRAGGAWADHHAVVAVGAAGDRRLELADVVITDALRILAQEGADDGPAVLQI